MIAKRDKSEYQKLLPILTRDEEKRVKDTETAEPVNPAGTPDHGGDAVPIIEYKRWSAQQSNAEKSCLHELLVRFINRLKAYIELVEQSAQVVVQRSNK
jgi:hypothetical protein